MNGNELSCNWSIEKSAKTYHIDGWGAPYFRINDKGHAEIDSSLDQELDLFELTRDLCERGLHPPLLIRFPNILQDRIRLLNESFEKAIGESGYGGVYRGVFPIKVNQQRLLIEDIVRLGRPWHFGLEAGSKPELLIALAVMGGEEGLIICNGYKDLPYCETALFAQSLGNTSIVVLGRMEELALVLRTSEKMGVRPCLGVRVKLSSKSVDRWEAFSGGRSKFGLNMAESLGLVQELGKRDMLDCLRLLHFHLGSQVSNIAMLKKATQEAAHVYVELVRLGCKMGYLDVGGGLAVDYHGSKSEARISMNYDVQEYAYSTVSIIKEICEQAGVAVPTIVSESGRSIVAHQSVLVFDVVGVDHIEVQSPSSPVPNAHRALSDLYKTWQSIRPENIKESWHDAKQALEEARSLFNDGSIGVQELADAERLFWNCCDQVKRFIADLKDVPEELRIVEDLCASLYFCNFSLFQSAPDIWAMDHLFPFMPLHRLDEEPTERALLADLTCDCDGVVDRFIDTKRVRSSLPLHRVYPSEPYWIGMFLGGAYQETLGDLHNLFGDTTAVHIEPKPGGYSVTRVFKGDFVHEVLRYLEYKPEEMIERVRKQAERALARGMMTLPQTQTLIRHYEKSLEGYTYLKTEL